MLRKLLAALLFCVACYAPTSAQAQAVGEQVQGVAINRSTLNNSATITTGNTFQTVLATSQGVVTAQGGPQQRQALTIQNNNATDSCWISFGVLANGTKITAANAAKTTSILLLAGQAYTRYWPYVPNDEIEATCASNSDTLYVDVQ
jgi:hypothetical protein